MAEPRTRDVTMMYLDYDHAGWVERNNAAGRARCPSKKSTLNRVTGYHAAPEKLSPFHRRAVTILGLIWNGINNAPIIWGTVHWYSAGISVGFSEVLSSFDGDGLTKLVMLCHDARIRVHIRAAAGVPGELRLTLWQRQKSRDLLSGHPSLGEAVAAYREALPLDRAAALFGVGTADAGTIPADFYAPPASLMVEAGHE
jgi:hypothetical protein